MTVQSIAYVEFQVEDAHKSGAALAQDYGFALLPLDLPHRPGVEAVLARQGGIRLLLVSAVDPGHPVADFVRRHGDGVAVIALRCADPAAALERAVAGGARRLADPGAIAGFGDIALSLVDDADPVLRAEEPGPDPESTRADPAGEPAGALLHTLDHVAICLPGGELAGAVAFAERALGLAVTFREYIEVGDQAMDSRVVRDASGRVTFTLLEPDLRRSPGQIDGFLQAHGGAGVQHLAFETADIARAVRELGRGGVEFLSTPATYYEQLTDRIEEFGIPVETLRELDVLVDEDHGGQLFQIFTRSVHPRRTFFLELVERRGAGSFGSANIKALYEAVERQRAAGRA
ncbi:4-hydroxyphenylpyruvate dioxygenase [Kitasatospora nipponensis]|uniref:4-hydroxyphenylpyruvate dioxygenase n=1 Tax=Kitasatospora nipponensis TaxID=258049 RepID=A0ABN1TAG8_9ACTN